MFSSFRLFFGPCGEILAEIGGLSEIPLAEKIHLSSNQMSSHCRSLHINQRNTLNTVWMPRFCALSWLKLASQQSRHPASVVQILNAFELQKNVSNRHMCTQKCIGYGIPILNHYDGLQVYSWKGFIQFIYIIHVMRSLSLQWLSEV